MKIDQYGNEVNFDRLVPLQSSFQALLTEREVQKILDTKWYETEPSGIILVDFDEVGDLVDDTALCDVGITPDCELMLIDLPLHRYNTVDGFYHA